MGRYRQDRVNDAVKEEMAQILRDVKDPRITSAFVSITAAQVTKDLKFAKIYFSLLDGDPKEVKKALTGATGFFRSELAKRLNLRITPQLAFEYDGSMKYGANISTILNTLDIKPEEEYEDADN